MKKPDRQPRPRIPRAPKTADAAGDGSRPAGEAKPDAWRDAPKNRKAPADAPRAASKTGKDKGSKSDDRHREDGPRADKKSGGPDKPRADKRGAESRGEGPARSAKTWDRPGSAGKPDGTRKSFRDRDDRPARPPGEDRPGRKESGAGRPDFKKADARGGRRDDDRPAGERRTSKPFERKEGRERPSRDRPSGERPFRKDGAAGRSTPAGREERPFGKKAATGEGFKSDRPFGAKPARKSAGPVRDDARGGEDRRDTRRPQKSFGARDDRPARESSDRKPPRREAGRDETEKPAKQQDPPAPAGTPMTLNKYLAHAGLSSRRDAATAIKEGKVKVNGEVMDTPGYRVKPEDKVTFEGKAMKPQAKKVYVLLNKPKGFITTTDDEMDRRTVMELVQAVEAERLYPVGRLDRNTTGLLLMTNDGDLAQRLTHPKYEAKKIYQVGLDKPLTKADFEKLLTTGVELEDGIAKPDKLSFLETPDELGLEIHSGRNRIVRRMFEALGYSVEKLDRVMFAGLTKKNIPRGQWRHLTEQEVVRLKHFKP